MNEQLHEQENNINIQENNINILVVDDTFFNLSLLTAFLKEHGYEVRPAPNGNLALRAVESRLPDLILLDIMMPDLDGYEVCRRLKAAKHSQNVPVIFLSAAEGTVDKVKAFGAGGVDYITKPFEPEEVLARIKTHLTVRLMQQKLELQNQQLQQEIAERQRYEKELIQARNELIQSEKMASLGRLVAGFSHEINTPIGVALGAISSLQENVDTIHEFLQQEEVAEEELIAVLENIGEAANLTLSNLKRAAHLVNHFKQTAIDKAQEPTKHFAVKTTILEAISALHHQFKQTSIAITVVCPDDLMVLSTPVALEQILTHLMINSLIHGFEEGKADGNITITAKLNHSLLQLEYTDTGKGIEPKHREKIFEPFFTSRRTHGSGLGLYICYNLVTIHLHGTISCDSVLGKGVSFKIAYPVQL
jgi:C4-dicarboxylate-specific signal transduction histidine kinase